MQIQRETELSIDAQESSVTDELSSGLPPEDMAFLEGKFEDGESSEALFQETSDSAFPTMESLLRNPAAVAAQEQIAEARKAIGFGERSIAIGHLRKALEYKPLDIWASYTLAQLLMQSGRKKDCRDAFTIASRAGKMAQHDGRKIRAADCFMLAAKAANAAGDPGSGLSSALKATEITPWLAAARIELACQYLSDNNISEAISQAKFAFQIHPVSIQNLMHETQFIQRPDLAKQVFDTTTAMAEKWLKSLSHCQSSASKLAQSTGMKDCQPRGRNPESAEDKNPVALSYRCRLLSLECLRLLGRVAAKVKDMHVEFGQAKELASYRPVPGYSVKLFLRESVCIDVVEKLPVGTNVSKYLPVIFGKHTPEKVFQIAPFEGVIEKYYLESDKIVAVDIYQFSGAGSNTAESDAESSEAALKAAVSSFCRNLVEYEKTINASQSIMPAPSIHRAKVGGLVRYDKKTAADREDLVIDSHPLPENMRGFVDESAFAMDNRFYLMRVTAMTSGKLYLSRWRTYFG